MSAQQVEEMTREFIQQAVAVISQGRTDEEKVILFLALHAGDPGWIPPSCVVKAGLVRMKIRDLRCTGVSDAKVIAARVGCDKSTVYRIFHEEREAKNAA